MRALVTGCAGFIGSHLTESLLADGHDVVGVDALINTYPRAVKLGNLERAMEFDGFRFLEADLMTSPLDALVEECDAVFHLAAEPGVRTSWGARFESYTRNNVLATQRLLETAKAWPDKPIVYASSSSIYGDAERLPTPEDALPWPSSPYGVTKLAAEHLCALYHGNYEVATVSLRYFSAYGPRQRPDMAFNRFCRAALRSEPLTIFGNGEQTRDFTFVDDVVAATRAAAVSPTARVRVYNVGGGSRVSVNDALELIVSFVGRPLEVRHLESKRGDVRDTGADTTRARRELGFNPTTSLEAGLQAEFEWMESQERSAHTQEPDRPGAVVATDASPQPLRRELDA
jgi:nucleoside-diphosphate-sugar epimerase